MRILASIWVGLGLTIGAASAEGVYGASFQAISGVVHETAERTAAPGAALILGTPEAVFYVETAGAVSLATPIVLPYETDLMQAALVLSLIDSGHVRPGDPRLAPGFATRSAGFGTGSRRGRQAMVHTAELAANRDWATLFYERLAEPIGLKDTRFPAHAESLPLTHTTTRDYARLIAVFAGEGAREGLEIISRSTMETALRPESAGSRLCVTSDTSGACTLIETSGPGLYAFIDRTRSVYGVFTAPGTEDSLIAEGQLIRDMAIAITDKTLRRPAPSGLTAATREAAH